MNPTEEHDDLWELLGKAREPAISPFFSRNVLRDVRALEQKNPATVVAWLQQRWRFAMLAACGMAAAAAVSFVVPSTHDAEERQLLAMAERVSEGPDYQVISHLDELLDSEENSVWLDNASTF